MQRYDSIVIGAGHNGLVCAAYLARSGQRVLVLEGKDSPGGLAAGREFHPGYHVSVAHSTSHLPDRIVTDLDLAGRGYRSSEPMPTVAMDPSGRHTVIDADHITGVSDEDSAAYAEYRRLLSAFADALAPFWMKTMPSAGGRSLADIMTCAQVGVKLRRLGKNDMREFLRVAALPMRDLVDEYFDSELLKSALAWDGLIGSKMAPRSPNGSVLMMLYRMSTRDRGAHRILVGSVPGLVAALVRAAEAAGVTIRYSSHAEKIEVVGSAAGLSVRGVRLASGEAIEADRVISSADPKRTFFDLLGVEYLDIGFTNRVRRLRSDGYVGKLHLALDELPGFAGLHRPDGRLIFAPDLDTIEFAYDAAKYGECPEQPVLEAMIPSLHDSSLAPEGRHVLSAHVMYVPYRLKGGWNDLAKATMCDRAIETLARHAPGIRDRIVHAEFLTPADLEQEYCVTGGHWHHAEFSFDQMLMMRPTYEAGQYATPIPGFYLCGAGCHPAGDLTGAAGHNAARAILR